MRCECVCMSFVMLWEETVWWGKRLEIGKMGWDMKFVWKYDFLGLGLDLDLDFVYCVLQGGKGRGGTEGR